jgi:hypothetical protein
MGCGGLRRQPRWIGGSIARIFALSTAERQYFDHPPFDLKAIWLKSKV